MTYDKLAKIASSFGLRDSILHIWAYSLHIGYGLNLPMGMRTLGEGCPIK